MFRTGLWSIVQNLSTAAALCAVLLAASLAPASAAQKPKIRSITAFIRLDTNHHRQQITEAVTMLRNTRSRFELAGYNVQTIRIATQPFTEYTQGMSHEAALAFFHDLDALASQQHFIAGIGPALLNDSDDPAQAQLLAEILSANTNLSGSVVVAGSDGVHWKSVTAAAGVMKFLEDHTEQSLGNFRFAALANVPAYTPFFPAAYHQGLGQQFAIALESANVVAAVMGGQREPEAARQALIAELGKQADAIEDLAGKIDRDTGWTYMGMDLSPAPMKEVSIAAATSGVAGGKFGTCGTLTASATITSALREITVKKVGYSGLMMPVLEDNLLAQLWSDGALSMDQLLAYSAVCGTGLDTIPLPGDVTAQQLERIIGDVASLSAKSAKPLSARLLPVAGLKAGDRTMFEDPNLVNAVLQPLPH